MELEDIPILGHAVIGRVGCEGRSELAVPVNEFAMMLDFELIHISYTTGPFLIITQDIY